MHFQPPDLSLPLRVAASNHQIRRCALDAHRLPELYTLNVTKRNTAKPLFHFMHLRYHLHNYSFSFFHRLPPTSPLSFSPMSWSGVVEPPQAPVSAARRKEPPVERFGCAQKQVWQRQGEITVYRTHNHWPSCDLSKDTSASVNGMAYTFSFLPTLVLR